MHASETRIGKEQMKILSQAIGNEVTVHYSKSRFPSYLSGVLKSVTPFRNVQVGEDNIPFIGCEIAIREIIASGNMIYRNKRIPTDYGARKASEIHYFVMQSFTEEGMAERIVTRPELALLRTR